MILARLFLLSPHPSSRPPLSFTLPPSDLGASRVSYVRFDRLPLMRDEEPWLDEFVHSRVLVIVIGSPNVPLVSVIQICKA